MRLLIIFLFLLLNSTPIFAFNWINTENVKKPIIFLDKDSIYKISDKFVYAIRYCNNKQEQVVVTIIADFYNNKAGIISISPYKNNMKYNYNDISDAEMKPIGPEASMYNAFLLVKEYSKGQNIKTYSNEEVFFEDYIENLKQKINSNYTPNNDSWRNQEGKPVIISASISKNGYLLSRKITAFSPDSFENFYALQALDGSAPFEALPDLYNKDNILMEFIFQEGGLKKIKVENANNSIEHPNALITTSVDVKTPTSEYFWQTCTSTIKSEVEKKWQPAKSNISKSAVINFRFDSNFTSTRKILDWQIVKSSNDKDFDNGAIQAVQDALSNHAYFLPSNKGIVTIPLTFNYKVEVKE